LSPALVIEAVEAQRAIVRSAQAKTRTARRARQLAQRSAPAVTDPLQAPPAPAPLSDIDWGKPAQAFEGEIWSTRRRLP
jgi:putative transposase